VHIRHSPEPRCRWARSKCLRWRLKKSRVKFGRQFSARRRRQMGGGLALVGAPLGSGLKASRVSTLDVGEEEGSMPVGGCTCSPGPQPASRGHEQRARYRRWPSPRSRTSESSDYSREVSGIHHRLARISTDFLTPWCLFQSTRQHPRP